jgi:hypothetical protein
MHFTRLGTDRYISKPLISGEGLHQVGLVDDKDLAAMRCDPGVLHVQYQVAARISVAFGIDDGPIWSVLPTGMSIFIAIGNCIVKHGYSFKKLRRSTHESFRLIAWKHSEILSWFIYKRVILSNIT